MVKVAAGIADDDPLDDAIEKLATAARTKPWPT